MSMEAAFNKEIEVLTMERADEERHADLGLGNDKRSSELWRRSSGARRKVSNIVDGGMIVGRRRFLENIFDHSV